MRGPRAGRWWPEGPFSAFGPAAGAPHGALRGLAYRSISSISSVLLAILLATLLFPATRLTAQLPEIRGYYLNAAAAVGSTPLTEGGLFDFQRLRLMAVPRLGGISLDIAYEHALELRTAPLTLGRGFEGAEAAGPWLRLQGTLVDGRRVRWRHGFDRLSATAPLGRGARVTAGRQTVSWATTLFLTPADAFAPFDPADPFREFRGGIDAARAQVFLGPLSQLDLVVRPARTGAGTTLTALGRFSGVAGGIELSGWAGALHDEPAAALAAAGAAGAWALRGEASLRREGGETILRGAAGVDRRITAFERDLHLVLEYQRDGFGARRPEDLLAVAASDPFRRGELQVLGRDALAASASYQAHPLIQTDIRVMANLNDGSILLAPGMSYSAADEVSLRLGAFAGAGRDATVAPPRLGSEYGPTPLVGYVAVSVFF